MGVVNVTPDSFSDGGRFHDEQRAVGHALQMEADGVDILDIGGESTRPGSERVSLDDELSRVVPVIRSLRERTRVPISIDTYKARVAEAALKAGAAIINDISGMTFDADMISLAAEAGVPVIVMHTADDPKVMQKSYHYDDVVEDIRVYFLRRIEALTAGGVREENIVLDPGIGFGKSPRHNLRLIRECNRFAELGRPVLIGPSRKAFIGAVLDLPVEDRLEGTLAAVAASIFSGAHILRVHDVKETVRVARMCDAFLERGLERLE